MFSRYIKSGILTLIAISIVVGCSALVQASDALAGVYVYEKTGFGGEFTITLNSDGTFQYYEGALSSTFGNGTLTLEDGLLCITEENARQPRTNCFRVEDGSLVFQAEDSDNFMFVKVLDGEQFNGSES